MSDLEVMMYTFIVIAAVGSYWVGHKKGVSNTVEFLEREGILEFEAEE
ncbi:MAG: hypothetical protein HOM18_14440 [Candidatus Marinimicrobia bacterium]|nr:hypothetical protein [Candidatus Neomarinimicrobiota bacterium]